MGLGRRFLRALGATEGEAADPRALVDAAVVPLSQGPMLVAGLQARGISAVGVESFNVITDTRSQMRIMVVRADLAAATAALEVLRHGEPDGRQPDPDDPDATDGRAQAAMADLFLAADRLWHAPGDPQLLSEFDRQAELIVGTSPPFGVEPSAWEHVASLCAAVVDADPGDEDLVEAGALALRSFLRDYV